MQLRLDLIYQLRWNVFESLESVEVEDRVDEHGTERRLPFVSHPIAAESVAKPPLHHMILISAECSEASSGDSMLPDSYEITHGTIDNADGSPLTLRDFVTGVNFYLNIHKELIVAYRIAVGCRGTLYERKPNDTHPAFAVNNDLSLYNVKPNSESGPIGGHPTIYFNHANGGIYHVTGDFYVNIRTWASGACGVSDDKFWAERRLLAARFHELEAKRDTIGSEETSEL